MNRWKFALSVGCFVLGILIALQFKEQKREGFPLTATRPAELLKLIKDSERERGHLGEEVQRLRARLTEYEFSKTKNGKMSFALAKELERTRLEAGVLPVKGPGVEIIMNDSKNRPKPGEEDYFYLVHDVDLIQAVNELWAIGAEAIAVNGQRIVSNSSIRCVGPTILVNTVRLSPSYTIAAIGDPDALDAGLKMRGGFLSAMGLSIAHGVTVTITKLPLVHIPPFDGVTTFRYALPELK